MIAAHIEAILWFTGVVTALPIVQFIAPRFGLKLLFKVEVHDPAGLLFARHWGLLAFTMGGLLLYAAGHPQARYPILLAAMIEKAGLVGLIAAEWNALHTRGLRLTLAFDAACSVIFAAWLLGV